MGVPLSLRNSGRACGGSAKEPKSEHIQSDTAKFIRCVHRPSNQLLGAGGGAGGARRLPSIGFPLST